jgi:hypothetical protein
VLEDLTGHLGRATHEWQPEGENRTPARGKGRKIAADRPDRDRRCAARVNGNTKSERERFDLGHAEIKEEKNSVQKMKYKKRLSPARSGEDKNQGRQRSKQLGRTKFGQRTGLSSTTNAQI